MLTRQGWAALGLAAISAASGRVFGVLELIILGSGVLALVVASLAWANVHVIALNVSRRVVPEFLQAGDTARVEFTITNESRSGTAPLTLWEPVDGLGGATLKLAPLRGHETATTTYRLPTLHRGTLSFGPLTAQRRDPFGIAGRRRIIGSTHEIVIFPAHHHLTLPTAMGGSGPLGNQLRSRSLGRSGNEFHSLRDYADGDDLRQIHWRASARSEVLKVREVEPEGLRHCTIELDNSASEYSPEGFERAVSAAASAVYAASVAGLRLRLVIGAETDLRNTNLTSAMTALANCSTTDQMSTQRLAAPRAEGLGLTIIVTGSPQSSAVSTRRPNLAQTDVLVVVACSSTANAQRHFTVDATTADSLSGSWASLTGSHITPPSTTLQRAEADRR
ncbi:MAG: DUF58 domain-containing protein [Actinomycetota bacterium]